jgi:glyoxylase-like metal-dependent hydrolase (beta-lactamase superfamily II)
MAKNKTYHVRVLKMGQCDVPGPEIYWMSHWDTWETLYFWMVVIQARGFTAVINTGPPADLTELNHFWLEFAGERCQMIRQESERPANALQNIGVDPAEVDYVFLSPLQGYATANVPLFRNATVCISRRGWIEDFHAPLLEMHVSRRIRIPNDVVEYLCITAPEKVRLLPDEETEIVPGIRTFWAGVHHRSSMAVCVDTPRGRVVASDCLFNYENVEQNAPLGIAESLEECIHSYDRIRKAGSILLPLYDPDVLKRHPSGKIA